MQGTRERAPLVLFAAMFLAAFPAAGADEKKAAETPSLEQATKGMQRRDGLLPVWVDAKQGKLWLELPPPQGPYGETARLIYVTGLAQGLGSNQVGLDRGRLDSSRLIVVRRVANRVLFEQQNLSYRATSDDTDERRAVQRSFATSVIWAAKIAAQDPDGRSLVDLTSFLVRDAHGIAAVLRSTKQGTYKLDGERSVVDLDACLAFPDNLELEALLTFSGDSPGRHLRSVTPTPQAITLRLHHSLVRLPAPGYRPRVHDPRAGSFAIRFQDYAAPLGEPLERRWIVRHRLQKIDPGKARSKVREPIVYYVDRGVPEPVRGALLDGARWWADAFDAAGFVDAFRVELLPEGTHPLDMRYDVIQWVHRSTRGWSFGGGVVDPRSGEMIKGHVRLGSLRVRQDRLLFEALLGTDKTGSGEPDDPVELALARIRQLSAHEVGHTLGLTHNFAASTYGRASVMDYPAPWITLQDGRLDASSAYAVGVGAWDKHAIRYAYAEFPGGADEAAELDRIVREGLAAGLAFVADADARPPGAAQPLGNLWDNGAEPIGELERLMRLRAHGLERFGERSIAPGRPLALLQEALATLYFHHRYQLDAAAKVIGGLDYRYAVRGDGQPAARPIDAARQRRALAGLLDALSPAVLDLPESVLEQLLPRPFGYGENRELFRGNGGPAFDPLAAAATAADMVVRGLLQPQRCHRLVDFHRRDAALPSLSEVVGALVDHVFANPDGESARHAEIRRAVRHVVVDRMIALAGSDEASVAVRARIEERLAGLARRLDGDDDPFSGYLAGEIARFLGRPHTATKPDLAAPEPPPGSPIGAGAALDRADCSFGPG